MIDYTWKSKGATGNVRPPKQIRPQRDKALLTLVRLGGLGWQFGRGCWIPNKEPKPMGIHSVNRKAQREMT